MSVAGWLKSHVGDSCAPGSLAARARRRRWDLLLHHFPDLKDMRVLDLGGYARGWVDVTPRPRQIVTLNIDVDDDEPPAGVEVVRGDACAPPAGLLSRTFDLVYSNSLIEHVGGHARRQQLGDVVRALAPAHWIQTPYRYFPVEAHYLFPGFQFLPVRARAELAHRWPISTARSNRSDAVGDVLNTEFLSRTEMRHYFPTSEILNERFIGFTKSLIAVRHG